MRIAILHDLLPLDAGPEDQDTLDQARTVAEALEDAGHACLLVPFDPGQPDGGVILDGLGSDAAFNLVEGCCGKGALIHTAPAALEEAGMPFTGSGSRAMQASSHKTGCKAILAAAGIPTPDWLAPEGSGNRPDAPSSGLWIIKSVSEHASLGLDEDSVIDLDQGLDLYAELLARRKSQGGDNFAELFIDGREFNLALVADNGRPRVLPPAEMVFEGYGDRPRVVGWRAKWDQDSEQYARTVRRFDFGPEDAPLLARLEGLAMDCWNVLGLAGYARVDFRVDAAGQAFAIDVNANPCLAPDAGFSAAAARAGLDFGLCLKMILDEALARNGAAREAA